MYWMLPVGTCIDRMLPVRVSDATCTCVGLLIVLGAYPTVVDVVFGTLRNTLETEPECVPEGRSTVHSLVLKWIARDQTHFSDRNTMRTP
jgi:hypothetical protein